MSAFIKPDHLRDHSPAILWVGTTEATATFTAPWDGLLVTHLRSTGEVAAANPLYTTIRVVGMPAPTGEIAALVNGIPIAAGTEVSLTAGEDTGALVDLEVSDVLRFVPAAAAVAIGGGFNDGAPSAATLAAAAAFDNTAPGHRPL
jgi:hypothetical protein